MEIKILKKLSLKSPIMLAGAPGMGLVAKHTVDYFIKKLCAKELGRLSSDYDYYSIAVFDDRGVLEPCHLNSQYRFYFLRAKGAHDFVFFTADFQPTLPEKQNELSDIVAKVSEKLKVKRIYTTAAVPVREKVAHPKVFGTATAPELMDFLVKKGIEPLRGRVSGFNGVLLEYAWKRGIEACCLLAETYIYHIDNPLDPIDFKAVLAVTNKISELMECDIDTEELEREIERREALYKKLEEEYKKAVAPKIRKEVPSYIG
ncbi:MAG: PAC2 family protein [Candidatus Thermoplasmatota archaeon]|nr:PAC2 family protein [Candidatus Thermoplasmatota archaeon]MDI6855471.1 PAC2 family protein [Candidatus Thermoplasmatota archaeon]